MKKKDRNTKKKKRAVLKNELNIHKIIPRAYLPAWDVDNRFGFQEDCG